MGRDLRRALSIHLWLQQKASCAWCCVWHSWLPGRDATKQQLLFRRACLAQSGHTWSIEWLT